MQRTVILIKFFYKMYTLVEGITGKFYSEPHKHAVNALLHILLI